MSNQIPGNLINKVVLAKHLDGVKFLVFLTSVSKSVAQFGSAVCKGPVTSDFIT